MCLLDTQSRHFLATSQFPGTLPPPQKFVVVWLYVYIRNLNIPLSLTCTQFVWITNVRQSVSFAPSEVFLLTICSICLDNECNTISIFCSINVFVSEVFLLKICSIFRIFVIFYKLYFGYTVIQPKDSNMKRPSASFIFSTSIVQLRVQFGGH